MGMGLLVYSVKGSGFSAGLSARCVTSQVLESKSDALCSHRGWRKTG